MSAATQLPTLPPPPPPLPLPPPPLSLPSPSSSSSSTSTSSTVHPRLRHRRLASSSSSSSSSASIFSQSPSPSRPSSSSAAATAKTTHAVVVPFSWELHPGIPKNASAGAGAATAGEPLPLPPPLRASPRRRRSHHRRRRSDGATAATSSISGESDPFAAAFAECTREENAATAGNFRPAAAVVSGRRSDASGSEHRWWLAGGSGIVGFLDLYGCKSAMAVAVADAAFLARRRPAMAHAKPSRITGRRDKVLNWAMGSDPAGKTA
uniref:Uncharacterized protein n=1 Tax=Leersia perrieri TaxID=77586 RepID=A0A0D9XXE2_9ORYZ